MESMGVEQGSGKTFKKFHLARKDWYKNIWSREVMDKIFIWAVESF